MIFVFLSDFDGWTPLHAASHWAQKEACEVLCENYIDEFYDFILLRPLRSIANLFFKLFEINIIDATVNGTGQIVKSLGLTLRTLQNGYVKTYAVSILFGAVCIILFLVFK